MSKEFTFEETFTQGSKIYSNKQLIAPFGLLMYFPCNELLPCTILSLNEDTGIGSCNFSDGFMQKRHPGRTTHNLLIVPCYILL